MFQYDNHNSYLAVAKGTKKKPQASKCSRLFESVSKSGFLRRITYRSTLGKVPVVSAAKEKSKVGEGTTHCLVFRHDVLRNATNLHHSIPFAFAVKRDPIRLRGCDRVCRSQVQAVRGSQGGAILAAPPEWFLAKLLLEIFVKICMIPRQNGLDLFP